MSEPRGPTTEELRARALAHHRHEAEKHASQVRRLPQSGPPLELALALHASDAPIALLLERPCLACNREPGQRMCDLCQRLEIAEASGQ